VEYPQFIDPTKEDIVGKIEAFDQAPTKFGDAIVVTLATDNRELRSLWLTQTVLKSRFARLKPQIGERIVVRRTGMREGAGGPYHDFDIEIPDRPPFVPDWDKLGGDIGPSPEPA
jgi:hypothetical protein